MTITLSNLNRFLKHSLRYFFNKFVDKWTLKISLHLACVATLPCETKQAIKDKLQGAVEFLIFT